MYSRNFKMTDGKVSDVKSGQLVKIFEDKPITRTRAKYLTEPTQFLYGSVHSMFIFISGFEVTVVVFIS